MRLFPQDPQEHLRPEANGTSVEPVPGKKTSQGLGFATIGGGRMRLLQRIGIVRLVHR